MFIETGASCRSKFRKMFDSKTSAINDINKYKEYSNVYHSIYWYREKEEKLYPDGNFKRFGPDYTSAIINRIVFDLDSFHKVGEEEVYDPEGIQSIRNFRDWCERNNYRRKYVMSGGGFYGILMAEGHPLKLRDAMFYVSESANIEIDPAVIGDTGRMMRVMNSFNFGNKRRRYCIPLKEEELDLTFEEIRDLAKKPRFRESYLYGENIFSIDRFSLDKDKIKRKNLYVSISRNSDVDDILLKYGWSVKDFCDPIKHIISLDHVGHFYRYELIKYFKSVVKMEIEDNVNLLAALLGNEGIHSFVEGQAGFIYRNNRVFNPEKLKQMGLCPKGCHKCLRMRFIV